MTFESCLFGDRVGGRRRRNLLTAISSKANPETTATEQRVVVKDYLRQLRGAAVSPQTIDRVLERVQHAAIHYQAQRG